jgi:hypothetical protein
MGLYMQALAVKIQLKKLQYTFLYHRSVWGYIWYKGIKINVLEIKRLSAVPLNDKLNYFLTIKNKSKQ